MAIEDAKQNAKENSLQNTTFIAGDIRIRLTDANLIKIRGKPDVIITDPPCRHASDGQVQNDELNPEKIVYVKL